MENTVPGTTLVLNALILLGIIGVFNLAYAAWRWLGDWWRRKSDQPDFTPEKIAELEDREGKVFKGGFNARSN